MGQTLWLGIAERATQHAVKQLDRRLSTAIEDIATLQAGSGGGGGISLPIAMSDVSGLIAALAAKASTTHTHAQSDVTNLVSDLAAKVGTTRAINTTAPLSGGGDLSADRTISIDMTGYAVGAGFFGDGSHGNLDFDGVNTVNGTAPFNFVHGGTILPAATYRAYFMNGQDIYAHNMTLASGVLVNPGGGRIFVKRTLTLGSGSVIDNSGGDGGNGGITAGGAQGGTALGASAHNMLAGTGGVAGGLAGGGAVSNGTGISQVFWGAASGSVSSTTTNGNNGGIGQGGAGGGNGVAAGGTGGSVTLGGESYTLNNVWQAVTGRALGAQGIRTGTCGGGGRGSSVAGTGGGGGAGAAGGYVMVAAYEVVDNGSVGIQAKGGWGGNAYYDSGLATNNGGGGGGGAGGICIVVYCKGNPPTPLCTGGQGGAHGATGGGNGGNGGNGFAATFNLSV